MCHLQELYAKYKDKGLVILGFDASDDKKIALEMLHDNGATFPNIVDSSDAAIKVCFQQYQGRYGSAVPMNYIIDREGKVVVAWYGGGREHPQAMSALSKSGGELGEAARRDFKTKVVNTVMAGLLEVGGELSQTIRRDIKAQVVKATPEIAAAARRLFEVLRSADYEHEGISTRDCKHSPAKEINYNPERNDRGWISWVCKKFKANPITEVRLGDVFDLGGLPAVHFELLLKDGEVLQGDLPFYLLDWGPNGKQWVGHGGLDWHLQAATREGLQEAIAGEQLR